MTPEELHTWRTARGYTQLMLARLFEVDVKTLYRWEHGLGRIPAYLPLALQMLDLRAEQAAAELGELVDDEEEVLVA